MSTPWRRIASQTTSAPMRVRVPRAVARTADAAVPSWSISRWARSTAAACSVPAAGTWLRRAPRDSAGAAVGVAAAPAPFADASEPGGFAVSPFVIVIAPVLPSSRIGACLRRRHHARNEKNPRRPGEGPVGLRWFVASVATVPPRPSVLPPGAGNEEPEKALNADQDRPDKG